MERWAAVRTTTKYEPYPLLAFQMGVTADGINPGTILILQRYRRAAPALVTPAGLSHTDISHLNINDSLLRSA